MAGETIYCDDYEAIVGPKPVAPEPEPRRAVETKVVAAPEPAPVAPATVAETA